MAAEQGLVLPGARTAPHIHVWRALWELVHDLSVAVLFCFFLITFVAQAFRVQGTSMLPMLEDGERIIVNKFVYRFHPIDRGDVVVFWYPKDPSVSFIKRVIGMPDDTVELRNGVLYVNGQRQNEGYVLPGFRDDESYPPLTVKKGYYYVLGDNRGLSVDSRTFGSVPIDSLIGRVEAIIWPAPRVGRV